MRLAGELNRCYDFDPVALHFVDGTHNNLFSRKNNKTLCQTLEHPRYSKLRVIALDRYSDLLGKPLGEFLLDLKLAGDHFYKKFLNPYGDDVFSTFCVSDASFRGKTGVYAYVVNNQVMYVGRCRDALLKRIDHGYGKIHPKNCYLDGQATNCHLNALITKIGNTVELWFCSINTSDTICAAERELVHNNNPTWNIHKFG